MNRKRSCRLPPLLALTGLLASLLSAQDGVSPVCPLGAGWVFDPAFSDEFNVSQLDADKWWDFNPAWHGRKPAYFDRANVRLSDGSLQLLARMQDPAEVTPENRARGHDLYTTAIVKSKKRIRYGYFEARCRSMRANVCNAFWLYDPLDPPAKYREGDFSEEIDIFEVFGNPIRAEHERIFFATVHRHHTPYVESIVNAKKTPLPNYSGKIKMPFDFWADFHVYAFLWTPAELKWFVDGKEVFSRANDYFHRPLHVVFDAEIMEKWVGLPDAADLPATFSIDYVRVWQKPD
jgi:beta-glucanase (GH16 family)